MKTQAVLAAALDSPASAGMRAYRANVWGNWTGTLAGAYPIVRRIVGEAFFQALAREYACAHPSVGGDLNEYGAHLDAFVARFPHTQDLPYLPDVACMEWRAHRAYYAADGVLPDPFPPPEDWQVRLAPACALMESEWPLARIWEVHQDGYDGAPEVDLAAGPESILVHRPRWRAEVTALALGDYRFLQGISGGDLAEALAAAAAADPQFDPSTALARGVQSGVILL